MSGNLLDNWDPVYRKVFLAKYFEQVDIINLEFLLLHLLFGLHWDGSRKQNMSLMYSGA